MSKLITIGGAQYRSRLEGHVALLVKVVLKRLAAIEKRPRARKPKDETTYREVVEVLAANLAYSLLHPATSGSAIAFYLSHRRDYIGSRYGNPRLHKKTLRLVVDLLVTANLAALRVGRKGQATSTIEPTPDFVDLVEKLGASDADFNRMEGEEVIILNVARAHRYVRPSGIYDPDPSRERAWYRDTDHIRALRAKVAAINAFLRAADIEFLDDGQEPINPRRTLRRYFSLGDDGLAKAWGRNGRLYGGFWQTLKKERRENLRIQGEPGAILDFSATFPRLAFARCGVTAPPSGVDLYDLTGILPGYDNAVHRDGVKKAFNSLLNGGRAGSPEILSELPKGTKPVAIREALAKRHPSLARVLEGNLGGSLGMELMFTESQILLRCLNDLMARGIVALPIHDAIIVPVSHTEPAREAMERASLEQVGFVLPVQVKHPKAEAALEPGTTSERHLVGPLSAGG